MDEASASSKRSKLIVNSTALVDSVISDLAKINFTSTDAPQSFWDEGIASLKPGVGLIGNADEEKAFYEEYEEAMKEKPSDAETIRSADPEDKEPDLDDQEHTDHEKNGLTFVRYKPTKKDEEEVELEDFENNTFGSHYFINEHGEYESLTEHLGGAWLDHIVSVYSKISLSSLLSRLHVECSRHTDSLNQTVRPL